MHGGPPSAPVRRNTQLDLKGMTDVLNKKVGGMDPRQQAAWEIVQKLQILGTLIDYYSDLEEYHQQSLRNESFEGLFAEPSQMVIPEKEFTALLKMLKDSTRFILEREITQQKYQKALDSKNYLENDPIFQKLASLNTRLKTVETEREQLRRRNVQLEAEQEVMGGLLTRISELEAKLKEKELLVNTLNFNLNQANQKILQSDIQISQLRRDIEANEARIKGLTSTIEFFHIPLQTIPTSEVTISSIGPAELEEPSTKVNVLMPAKLFQHNKLLNVLNGRKSCAHLLSFLEVQEISDLASTNKSIRAHITNAPCIFRVMMANAVFDRPNLNATLIADQIKRLKEEVLANETTLITGVKRYLYYNYTLTDLVEGLVEESTKNIEKLKVDLSDKEQAAANEARRKSTMGIMKSFFSGKDDKTVASFKYNRVKKIPMDFMEKMVQLIQATPFDRMYLLDSSKKRIEINNPKEYIVAQNKLFREEIDKQAAVFMTEFMQLVFAMGSHPFKPGDNFESIRDLCQFMVKEIGKLYANMHIVLKEHHTLVKIKDFLAAELTVQHVELAIQRHQYLKLVQNGNNTDYQKLKTGAQRLEEQNAKLENENNRLKVNIIDLNDTIGKFTKKLRSLDAEMKTERERNTALVASVNDLNSRLELGQKEVDMKKLEDKLRDILHHAEAELTK